MRADDLIVTVAYMSIPFQILISLHHYPRLRSMPPNLLLLTVLFALFIFCCGAGHLLRCVQLTGSAVFNVMNSITALVSLATAVYLLPMIPYIMKRLDDFLDLARINDETVKSKMEFMAFLCHEIRNPLFAITSNITFICDGDLTEEQSDAVTSIQQSAELMLRLVNDVLEISKFESGRFQLENYHFDLRQLLEGVASSMKAQCKRRHDGMVKFSSSIADSVPQFVSGDSARLSQILYNLLSNANKFTSEGAIDFHVKALPYEEAVELEHIHRKDETTSFPSALEEGLSEELQQLEAAEGGQFIENATPLLPHDQTVLLIEVSDTGTGIPREHLKRVFEPYAQSKLTQYRRHGGTGLGLPIVAKIVEMMGGTVSIESTVNVGTTFRIYVPFHVAAIPGNVRLPSQKFNVQSQPKVNNGVNHDCTADDGTGPLNMRGFMNGLEMQLLLETPGVDADLNLSSLNKASGVSAAALPTNTLPSPNPPVPCKTSGMAPQAPSKKLEKLELPRNEAVVLVVDDNNVNRKLLGKMLSHFNVEFEVAENGQEAVDAVLASRNYSGDPTAKAFGMVLMDISMPVMDGCEATRQIRSHGVTDLPIVALTANALEVTQSEALEAGATEFATKPILREQLYDKCCEYLLKDSAVTFC